MRYIAIIIATLLLSSCKKDNSSVENYFIFGKAFGECGGNCATFFKVENGQVFADDMTYYTGQTAFSSTALSNSKYVLAKNLADNFPSYLAAYNDTTFGCPDCHDQGGIYLIKKENGTTKYWNIDTDTAAQPQPIRAYIQQTFATIDSLTQ